MPAIPIAALVLTLAALAAAGCGSSSSSGSASNTTAAPAVNPNTPEVSPSGDIPDNQAFVAFTPKSGAFSVKVPEGWSQTTAGGATTFTDKLNSIRAQSGAGGALSLADAKRTELPKLASTVAGYKAGTVTQVKRQAGMAIRITYVASAKPNAVTGKAGTDAVERYLFARNGTRLVLTLSGPKGADNVDPWKIVTDSVRWSR